MNAFRYLIGILFVCSFCLAADRPNIIQILADDLGWGDLNISGAHVVSPHIDQLTTEGVVFTNFYVSSPVCSPSRAAFMTGLYPSPLGLLKPFSKLKDSKRDKRQVTHLDPKLPMITRLFQKAGYRVGHFGKWHLGEVPNLGPKDYGIDVYQSGGAPLTATQNLVDAVKRFISQTPAGQPFYIQLWLYDVHTPILERAGLRKKLYHELFLTQGAYYSTITEVDTHIGRLMRFLRDRKLSNNTLTLLTSDNGPEQYFGVVNLGSTAHLRGRKRSLYEGGIRVPFIAHWPGKLAKGEVNSNTILGAVDMLPTLASVAQIKVPDSWFVDGEDMAKSFTQFNVQRKEPLFWERRFGSDSSFIHRSPPLAMRWGKWKLLMGTDGKSEELYDLKRNPSEDSNVANQNPVVVWRLKSKLLQWAKKLPKTNRTRKPFERPIVDPTKIMREMKRARK